MSKEKRIVVGSDHAAFGLKEVIKSELDTMGFACEDVGAHTLDPTDDYPVFARAVAKAVADGTFERGVALCGTGIGASMVANRHRGVRAALCVTPQMARMARSHNDSNVLVMGERTTSSETAAEILRVWLETPFDGGERHERRLTQFDPEN